MQTSGAKERLSTSVEIPGTASGSQHEESLEALEIKLLLEGLYAHYGFDFRDYAFSSLRRRVLEAVIDEQVSSVSQLQDRIFRDKAAWERLFLKLSVNVTSFFRDAHTFQALRNEILPALQDQPFLRIWHTGCATGEEVYSTAIVLHEAGLLKRCRIYATDMNEAVLRKARTGIFPITQVELAQQSYEFAGGSGDMGQYYSRKYDHAMFHRSLREGVLFSQHNLVTDGVFNEFDLIFARNVLIYFNKSLQDKVNILLANSLAPRGFIGYGERETMRYTPVESFFEPVMNEHSRITSFYRKRA